MFVGFLFTEKFFADIINMTYSCCVESGMICMEGCYEKNIVGVGIVDTSMWYNNL